MSNPQNEVLLYSGGLDSYIAWHYLKKPRTVFFALGHKYSAWELVSVHKTIPNTMVDFSLDLGKTEQDDAFIPLRNLYLAMGGTKYGDTINLVVQRGERDLRDRSPVFFEDVSQMLSSLSKKLIVVKTPFADITKSEMVRWYIEEYKGDPQDLLKTRSCYSTLPGPCGRCAACFRRWVAFKNNGIEEVTIHDMTKWPGINSYLTRITKKELDEQREEETITALKIAGIL